MWQRCFNAHAAGQPCQHRLRALSPKFCKSGGANILRLKRLFVVLLDLNALRLCRFALNKALAIIAFAADTIDGIDSFSL